MKLSKALSREKTNVPVKTTVTFNAPGSYVPPYGKSVVKIGGRGASGNPSTGGTYAGTNPGSGGNVAGYNPDTGGNVAGYNPASGGNVKVAGTSNYNPTYVHIGEYRIYNNNWTDPATGGHPTGYAYAFVDYYGLTLPNFFAYYTNPGDPGSTAVMFWAMGYVPGNVANTNPTYYNPYYPSSAYYNPYYPGSAYYNPYYPGTTYNNPYYPGTAGTPTNIGGVYFPGGASDNVAPLVASTTTALSYTGSGITITVPTGGYVTVTNV